MSGNSHTEEITLLEFLSGVTDYMERLAQANGKLLENLRAYQDVLVKGENDPIEKATPALDRLAGQARCIDEERRAFVDDFFAHMGWSGPRNFSAIAEKVRKIGVSDEEAMAFEAASRARMRLIEVLAEVDAQNSLNLILIGQGLTFADVSLRALLGLEKNRSAYGPSNPTDDPPSLLDAQA